MSAPRILVFAGSAREGSYNKKLARLAADAARQAGAEVTFLDLRDLPMPLFDEDLEAREGEHPNAKAFKALLKANDGVILASPEHNNTYSALLKNALDWASRKREGETPMQSFRGKVALLVSASPGPFGGARGLVHLRALLAFLGMIVLPDQLAIPAAHQAFNEDGSLKDAARQQSLAALAANLVSVAGKLRA
jgi:NAD(P)H-dependent FMN reductase